MLFLLDIQNLAFLTDLFLHSSHTSLQWQIFVFRLQSPGLARLTGANAAWLCSGCSEPWLHPVFPPATQCCSSPSANTSFGKKKKAILNWGKNTRPFSCVLNFKKH